MVSLKSKTKGLLNRAIKEYNLTEEQLEAVLDQFKHPEFASNIPVKHYWADKHTKIGVLSDTHIGSKFTDYSVLEDLMKRFKEANVDAVYHTGDVTEGYNRRKGHSFECELHGVDAQVDGVIERFPSIDKPIFFILGDHDHWHYESAGVDIGRIIDAGRPDMHSLGFFSAEVMLAPNIKIDLEHPTKGTAYALSYHPQKMIEAMSGGEKPNILLIGHYHKVEQLFYRNIHAFQTGCIENQTPWMRRMNLSAHKAGWILDIFHGPNGIDRLDSTLLPYY